VITVVILLAILFVAWLVAIFMIIVDSISVVAKILWLLAVTLLSLFAIPAYFILRHRRLRAGSPAASTTNPV
jgi:hypothetical protein